jgi:hypothetical protein
MARENVKTRKSRIGKGRGYGFIEADYLMGFAAKTQHRTFA